MHDCTNTWCCCDAWWSLTGHRCASNKTIQQFIEYAKRLLLQLNVVYDYAGSQIQLRSYQFVRCASAHISLVNPGALLLPSVGADRACVCARFHDAPHHMINRFHSSFIDKNARNKIIEFACTWFGENKTTIAHLERGVGDITTWQYLCGRTRVIYSSICCFHFPKSNWKM